MIYVKLESLESLARLACNFDYTSASILCAGFGSTQRIFVVVESIGDSPIAYYINVPGKESLISYTYPDSPGQNENAHFVKSAEHDQGVSSMAIIHIEGMAFSGASKVPKSSIHWIRLSSANDVVTAAIRKSAGTESLCNLYSFSFNGKSVICGFDLIDELGSESKLLYYAISSDQNGAKFARYKYSENKVDFTDCIGEHSYMYAKIIPLAEPFPFFNMPD
jgi:hypothetical protein